MNTALKGVLVAAGVAGGAFALYSSVTGTKKKDCYNGQGKPAMAESMRRLGSAAPALHWAVALLVVLGAAGLLLPGLLRFAGWLVPVSSAVVTVLLLVSKGGKQGEMRFIALKLK